MTQENQANNYIVIQSVSELLNVLKNIKKEFDTYLSSNFIFRGMGKSSWNLIPSVFRYFDGPQKSEVVTSGSYSGQIYFKNHCETEILSHFKKEAAGYLPNLSLNDSFAWLQHAQHYGVPTRLLDFTSNPLVALFFCCLNNRDEDGVVNVINLSPFHNWSQDELYCKEIYPLHSKEDIIESILSEMGKSSTNTHTKCRPIFFIPPYLDQRMIAQTSRFLLWGSEQKSLEEMIDNLNYMIPDPNGVKFTVKNDQRFLLRLVVPKEDKTKIIKELDLLNINEKTLFPGLDGIGKYINKYHQFDVDAYFE